MSAFRVVWWPPDRPVEGNTVFVRPVEAAAGVMGRCCAGECSCEAPEAAESAGEASGQPSTDETPSGRLRPQATRATAIAESPTQGRKPPAPHTCSGCSATWTGLATSHCAGCHVSFAGASLFDKHRAQYGEHGICRRPADLTTAGGEPVMFLREGVWRGPELSEEQKMIRFGRAS